MPRRGKRRLLIIGGHEDHEGDRLILRTLADSVRGGPLVVFTVAGTRPDKTWEAYRETFGGLDVRVQWLDVRRRKDALDAEPLSRVGGVLFTGGDQLRITSQLGDSALYTSITDLYEKGVIIAGTSAGAAVLSEVMLVGGVGHESNRLGTVRLAPGLGLLQDIIVDQHFAQRGRIGRLLGAVALNPQQLGVGIDEDTAIMVHDNRWFEVLGRGAVYVTDASGVTDSNVNERDTDAVLSICDVRLHTLSQGDLFDIKERRPTLRSAERTRERILKSA